MKGLSKSCKECGEVFFKKPTHSMRAWNERTKYCSRTCSNKHTLLDGSKQPSLESRRRGEQNNKWKGGKLSFDCKTCGVQFNVDRDRGDAKTCSQDCNKEYRKSEEFRNNLSIVQRAKYPEGRTFERSFTSLLRTCSRYAQWREKVLQRDDYTCKGCSKRGGKLHVDHIEAFVVILKRNNVQTHEDALWCEELWNVDNGQTLCLPCHYKTDTFGSKALKKLSTFTK